MSHGSEGGQSIRRDLIHAALALVLVPLTVVIVLYLMRPSPSVLAFPKPTHRVAVAVEAALRSELATIMRGEGEFATNWGFEKPNHESPIMGEVDLPEDYPAFWFIPSRTSNPVNSWSESMRLWGVYSYYARRVKWPAPMLVTLNEIDIGGQTRDGLDVNVTIRIDTIGEGSVVDFHGNSRLASLLSDRIANRLAYPQHKHESAEDRAALMAFFGSKPSH